MSTLAGSHVLDMQHWGVVHWFVLYTLHTCPLYTRSRFMRKLDREGNGMDFPRLYYPELYLLDGGYKAFYEKHPVREEREREREREGKGGGGKTC